MHLQLPAVRLGQLPERVAVPGPRPARSGRLSPLTRVTFFPHPVALPSWYRRRPGGELGGRRAPSFPTPRRLHRWLSNNTNDRENRNGKDRDERPQNVSLDGVVQDPDGEEGFRLGGWFVQFGGKDLEEWDKVALDEALGAEAWLLGRRSYEFFGARWRPRSGELADRLNSMPKYVVSSTLERSRLEQLDGPQGRRRRPRSRS